MSKTENTISELFGTPAIKNEAAISKQIIHLHEQLAEVKKTEKKILKKIKKLEKPIRLTPKQQNKIKYILGGLLLNLMRENEACKKEILSRLDASLEYENDRKLFGLSGGKKRQKLDFFDCMFWDKDKCEGQSFRVLNFEHYTEKWNLYKDDWQKFSNEVLCEWRDNGIIEFGHKISKKKLIKEMKCSESHILSWESRIYINPLSEKGKIELSKCKQGNNEPEMW